MKIGLTGGVACGKSTVGKLFALRGASVLRTDEVAHELMKRPDIHERIVEQFGSDILDNGNISRPKLAKLAFGEGRIGELNQILHPVVIEKVHHWFADQPQDAVALVEAALIFEANMQRMFDKVITVICNPETRIERFAGRQNLSREEAIAELNRRMATQIPDNEKASMSDFAIDNSGYLHQTEWQVNLVWERL